MLDERIKQIDAIVTEVKQSEEWEAVRMNILQIGEEIGKEIGKEIGQDWLLGHLQLLNNSHINLWNRAIL